MTILRDQEFSLAFLLGPVKHLVGCADQTWSSLGMQRVDGNSSGDFANEWLSKILDLFLTAYYPGRIYHTLIWKKNKPHPELKQEPSINQLLSVHSGNMDKAHGSFLLRSSQNIPIC